MDVSAHEQIAAPSRKQQLVEVAVFLSLIVPSMALSLFVVRQPSSNFVLLATATMVRDLALVSLVLYFLWRNGEAFSRLGWTRRHLPREFALGLLLFVPFFLATAIIEQGFLRAGLSEPSTTLPAFLRAQNVLQLLLAVPFVAIVALAEETVFRGYLLLRFGGLVRSQTATVLLSSAIFALGHGYEGTAGMATVGVMGAMLACVYLWRGSLVASIIMHFLQDFMGIVLLPLLSGK